MQELRHPAGRVANIIGVIDGIAFQTNILALNAAVEAARAGEQGRGFAVVGQRSAQPCWRSAEAAKEIKHLIDASVECVQTCTHQGGASRQHDARSGQRHRPGHHLDAGNQQRIGQQSQGVAEVGAAIQQMDQ